LECRRACFGSALNLNPHLHMLFLDGAYTFHGSRPTFHHARRPVGEELNRLLDRLSHRIVRVLERRGLLIADPEHPSLDLVPDSSLDHLQAASVAYRIAIGPHAGRKALTLYSVTPLDEAPNHPLLAQQRGRIHLSGVQRDKNMEQMFPAPLWLVVRRQVLAQVRKVEEVVDLAQQVILRHQVIEIEGIKQGFLRLVVVAHHGKELHP